MKIEIRLMIFLSHDEIMEPRNIKHSICHCHDKKATKRLKPRRGTGRWPLFETALSLDTDTSLWLIAHIGLRIYFDIIQEEGGPTTPPVNSRSYDRSKI